MNKENYYAERKQDLRNDFVELQIGGFDRFINLAAELQMKVQKLKDKYAELEKREKLAIAAEQAEKEREKALVAQAEQKQEAGKPAQEAKTEKVKK
jgi:hypothetical protein